jgi:hypothetical protein
LTKNEKNEKFNDRLMEQAKNFKQETSEELIKEKESLKNQKTKKNKNTK